MALAGVSVVGRGVRARAQGGQRPAAPRLPGASGPGVGRVASVVHRCRFAKATLNARDVDRLSAAGQRAQPVHPWLAVTRWTPTRVWLVMICTPAALERAEGWMTMAIASP